MKQAIIYGGAFNPPTVAHQAILQSAIDVAKERNAEVWLLPSGDRVDKTIDSPLDKRLMLLEAFIKSVQTYDVPVRIEHHELRLAPPTHTINTYNALEVLYPEYEQVWVFGSDSIQTMLEWGEGERLYNELNMLITERPGFELAQLPPKASLLQFDSIVVSSTQVREMLDRNEEVGHLVPPLIGELLVGY